MIPHIIAGIRMHQRGQHAPVDDQPRHERAELLGREQVDLEHARHVRPDRPVPDLVDAQLGELAADALPERGRKGELRGVGLQEVDVHVEAAAVVVGDGRGEGGVGAGFAVGGGRVGEGFAVGGAVAGGGGVSWIAG